MLSAIPLVLREPSTKGLLLKVTLSVASCIKHTTTGTSALIGVHDFMKFPNPDSLRLLLRWDFAPPPVRLLLKTRRTKKQESHLQSLSLKHNPHRQRRFEPNNLYQKRV